MTKPDIEAIRERAKAATPGPWGASYDEYCGYDCMSDAVSVQSPLDGGSTILEVDLGRRPTEASIAQHTANAVFAAHAREDIPSLLSYIDTLEAALRGLLEAIGGIGLGHESNPRVVAAVEIARAALEDE